MVCACVCVSVRERERCEVTNHVCLLSEMTENAKNITAFPFGRSN